MGKFNYFLHFLGCWLGKIGLQKWWQGSKCWQKSSQNVGSCSAAYPIPHDEHERVSWACRLVFFSKFTHGTLLYMVMKMKYLIAVYILLSLKRRVAATCRLSDVAQTCTYFGKGLKVWATVAGVSLKLFKRFVAATVAQTCTYFLSLSLIHFQTRISDKSLKRFRWR